MPRFDPTEYQSVNDIAGSVTDTGLPSFENAADTDYLPSFDGAADTRAAAMKDIVDSVFANVGGHSLAWLGVDVGKGGEPSFGEFVPSWEAPQAKTNDQQSGGNKLLDTVTGGIKKSWDKDPSELLKLGFGAIGGAYRDQEVKRAAALRRQQELDDRAAFNASVKGLRPARKGIIQGALKRMDGSPVFDASGKPITKG